MSKLFSRDARWIWLPKAQREYNSYACFRKTFSVRDQVTSARLRITADARYEVYVNGTWLGGGRRGGCRVGLAIGGGRGRRKVGARGKRRMKDLSCGRFRSLRGKWCRRWRCGRSRWWRRRILCGRSTRGSF